MKEIINIGIGQAGIQISESLINLYLGEHNLDFLGKKIEEALDNPNEIQEISSSRAYENLSSMFEEKINGIHKPRLLLVDCEPDVINETLKSSIGSLLNPEYITCGK